MSTVRLRTATAADLDAIMALETSSFGLTAWSRDTMAAELASDLGRYVVAVVDGEVDEVIGYAGLRAVGVEGDIQTICVDEQRRGEGIGRSLLDELAREARDRGVRSLFLEVREDNPSARHLYERLGWRPIGVRAGYYQPEGVDAITMRREL